MSQTIQIQKSTSNLKVKAIKCGVFINKDIKIEQLQSKNAELKRLIEQEMSKNKEYSQRIQQKRSKILNNQNQCNILQMQEMKLKSQINQYEKQLQKIVPLIEDKVKSVQSLTMQVNEVTEDYQNAVKTDQNLKAELQRYKQQIRREKLIYKSDSNAKKIYEDVNKKLISYEKNIEILQNKLQSKNKYLGIISKKIQKEEALKQKEKQISSSKKLPDFKNHTIISHKNIKIEPFNQEKVKPKKNNENMKDFNNLIRKKNEILSKKS